MGPISPVVNTFQTIYTQFKQQTAELKTAAEQIVEQNSEPSEKENTSAALITEYRKQQITCVAISTLTLLTFATIALTNVLKFTAIAITAPGPMIAFILLTNVTLMVARHLSKKTCDENNKIRDEGQKRIEAAMTANNQIKIYTSIQKAEYSGAIVSLQKDETLPEIKRDQLTKLSAMFLTIQMILKDQLKTVPEITKFYKDPLEVVLSEDHRTLFSRYLGLTQIERKGLKLV